MDLTFLFDVDNTLLDNDRAKEMLAERLRAILGTTGSERFWALYEAVRADIGMVDVPLTIARYEAERRVVRPALADLVMTFPFEDYLLPGALAALAHARQMGRVVILSDGDPIFQTSKIWRAGLTAAAGGNVVVVPHKEERLRETTAAFPADHYVLIEDKPAMLRAVRARLGDRVSTVFVRQGKYAAGSDEFAPDAVLGRIADFCAFAAADFPLNQPAGAAGAIHPADA
ncbi:MAG: haloacid dehalogenase-like hydrolase [Thermomicrobiales bacterium]|nr:haloacid dehalogenase-like hydrolase [Thermomicrobiales bacterium]